jgi:hypothetical protein
MDALCDAALSGHSTDQKHHMEESNTMSMEELPEKVSFVILYCIHSCPALRYQLVG